MLRESLVEENEVSLCGHRRESDVAKLLESVTIKHLPSSAHFMYFLTTLYTPSSPASAQQAYRDGLSHHPALKAVPSDPSRLDLAPTMVILHNPSDYLAEERLQSSGLEAFGSLLALFTSTFANLNAPSNAPLLVLHDSDATSLSLPVIPRHLRSGTSRSRRKRHREDEADGQGQGQRTEEDGDESEPEAVSLEAVMRYFFDIVGRAEKMPGSPSTSDSTSNANANADSRQWYKLTLAPSSRRLVQHPLETPDSTTKGEAQGAVVVEYLIENVDIDMPESRWGEEGRVVRMLV